MRLPPTVSRVRLGSSFLGAVVHTDMGVGGVAAAISKDLIALDEDNCVVAFADLYNFPQSSLYLGLMRR